MYPDTPTIVIVDDASDVRLLVKTRIRVAGQLRVVGEGSDGAEAVALAQEHQPSLMLLDVSMPGMDGLEALPLVLAASPSTQVVLYSGFEEHGLTEKALEMGAVAFIEKSVPLDSLMDRLVAVAGGLVADPSADASGADEPGGPKHAETQGGRRPDDQAVLDEHLERFRQMFDEAAIGMGTMTLTGHLVRANRALGALVQRPAEDLVGLFYGELTEGQEDLVGSVLEDILRRPLDVVQLEHDVKGAAGHRRVRATLAPVRDSTGRPLYLFLQAQDVTADTAASEALRRSEERFRFLVEAVQDYAIFMLDPTGHIASWNLGAERIKGYSAEEIIGKHFRTFYPPDVQARLHPEHELELALRDGHYEEDGWRIRKDGTRFWANVVITALYNPAGEHIGFAKVTRDTTDRLRLEEEREHAVEALATANSELEALNQLLRQAAEDQSEFLAVTAHELRSPIGVLGGSAETLSRHWAALTDEDRSELLEAMSSSTTRLRRLLGDLLTASRLQARALEIRPEEVPLREVISDAIATLTRTQPEAEVLADVPPEVMVTADRDRLAQALDNLLSNALRHGAPPVHVVVESDSGGVEIRVSDHGEGVAEGMRPRLFDRFATGRSKGGTGLGLFIVRELARAHGGEARYEPGSPDRPAGTFVISLPRPTADE